MTSTIIATNFPSSVTKDQIHTFFELSGSIDSIDVDSTTGKATVVFKHSDAVETALLLNHALFENTPISVEAAGSIQESSIPSTSSELPPAYVDDGSEYPIEKKQPPSFEQSVPVPSVSEPSVPVPVSDPSVHDEPPAVPVTSKPVTTTTPPIAADAKSPQPPTYSASSGLAGISNVAVSVGQPGATVKHSESHGTGHDSDDDVPQEVKPKAAVLAQYLAQGYVLSDIAIKKGLEIDKKKGFSNKFKSFITNLDDKYKIQDQKTNLTRKAEATYQNKYSSKFNKYFESENGSKVKTFYTNVVTDTKQIHEEAKKIAEAKKRENLIKKQLGKGDEVKFSGSGSAGIVVPQPKGKFE